MNISAMQRPYAVGVFDNHYEADKAMSDLLAAGFNAKQMGFAMRGDESKLSAPEVAEAYGQAALTRTSTGAVAGAILGGAVGAVSSLLIPGLGPVLMAGIMMAAGGGIAGAFAGVMSTMELSEEEKRYYHHELEAGRCLVFVKADDRYSEALAILESNGAHDATRREQGSRV